MTHSFPTGRSSELPAHAGEGHRSNQPPVGALKFDILVALAKDREPERYPYPQEAKHRKARDDFDNVDGEPSGRAMARERYRFFCAREDSGQLPIGRAACRESVCQYV